MDDALNEVERKALEQQRRSEWRAARLKSIDQERNESDAIIERLNLSSVRLPMQSSKYIREFTGPK